MLLQHRSSCKCATQLCFNYATSLLMLQHSRTAVLHLCHMNQSRCYSPIDCFAEAAAMLLVISSAAFGSAASAASLRPL